MFHCWSSMFDWVLNGPETHPNSNQILKPLIFNLATEIGLYFPRVALGGMALGLIAGKFIVFWLQHVFNDAMVEIAVTLSSTYLTFYIGEEVLGVSGVLGVVMLGIEINQHKTSISPEVEVFLHRYAALNWVHLWTCICLDFHSYLHLHMYSLGECFSTFLTRVAE